MKIISVFNNKGGVGKSTLAFHVAHALSEKGIKTLMVDLDPQSNLTLQCMDSSNVEKLWEEEQDYIDDFQEAQTKNGGNFNKFIKSSRSIHCLLKPVEDGVFDSLELGGVYEINNKLGLIPGRLSLHMFEDKLAKSWSDAFLGDPQAIRMLTAIRSICLEAEKKYGYEIAILDTSPSLGVLNRVVISLSTGFFVPCMPDMFSVFGIKNIGTALYNWKTQFGLMRRMLSDNKKSLFPEKFVEFLGYTIYNAKKYTGNNEYDLAAAHYGYAKKIPRIVIDKIPKDTYSSLGGSKIKDPIGGKSVMHSHNTLPSMSQRYHQPIWKVPLVTSLDPEDKSAIMGNRSSYLEKRDAYYRFVEDLIERIGSLSN